MQEEVALAAATTEGQVARAWDLWRAMVQEAAS